MNKCIIPPCRGNVVARGLCGAHYQKWQTYGDPLAGRNTINSGYSCDAPEGCDRPATRKGLCGMHYQRMRKNGDPATVRSGAGNRNHQWRGPDASYSSKHKRIRYLRGKPSSCVLCGKNNPEVMYHWACLTGDYDNPSAYHNVCVPCHKRWDSVRKIKPDGVNALTEPAVRLIRRHTGKVSIATFAAAFGVSRGAVHHVIKGRTWTHVE